MFTVKGKIGRRTYEIEWSGGQLRGAEPIVDLFRAEAEIAEGYQLVAHHSRLSNHLSDGYSVLRIAETVFDSIDSIEGDAPQSPGSGLSETVVV